MQSMSQQSRSFPVRAAGTTVIPAIRARLENLNRGFLAALVANILWGTSFLASKYVLLSWSPATASALRFVLATSMVGAGAWILGRPIRLPTTWRGFLLIFAIALTGFGLLYPLQLSGLERIPSGLSAAIMLLAPLLVLILGRFFNEDSFGRNKLIAVALGITGGIVLVVPHSAPGATPGALLMGSGLTFLAACSLAASSVLTRRLSSELDPLSLTFWSMLIGSLILVLVAWLLDGSSATQAFTAGSGRSWAALLFLSSVCSAACFFIWNYALSRATATEIASTMHIKTPTAILLGAWIAHEPFTPALVIGSAIVATGIWLSQQSDSRRLK